VTPDLPWKDAAPLGSNGRADENEHDQSTTPAVSGGLVRWNAPETSHEAARRIAGVSGRLCRLVLDHIRSCGPHGATDAETQAALGILMQTQTPRRNTLEKLGAVVFAGFYRPTPSGRRARVWVTPEHVQWEGGGE
jgi:hypothetical protein